MKPPQEDISENFSHIEADGHGVLSGNLAIDRRAEIGIILETIGHSHVPAVRDVAGEVEMAKTITGSFP